MRSDDRQAARNQHNGEQLPSDRLIARASAIGGSERDYPYDPQADVMALEGLEKLRAVEDRNLAGVLFKLFFQLVPEPAKHEEFDPATFGDPESEPDLNDLTDPTGSLADEADRNNAAIYQCWKEFYRNMEAQEQQRGRRYNAAQRATHIHRYGGILEKAYGRAHPTPTWEARHRDWKDRVVTKGGSFGGDR